MSDPEREQQEEEEEEEVYKSHNKPGRPAKLMANFEKKDEVVMKVKSGNKTMFLNFRVEDSRHSGGKWSYQLKAQDGSLHNGGAWFAERDLQFAK